MATQQQQHQPTQAPPAEAPTLASTAKASYTPLPPPAAYVPLRYPTNKKTIYDKNLNRRTSETSFASFAHLFNTLISYHHSRSPSVSELESRLASSAYPIGVKLLDLLLYRLPNSRTATRPTRLLELLQFIHTTLWRSLFGRSADNIEQANASKYEYMIIDNEPLVNTYISIPKEMSQLNCAAFIGGIIEGVCDSAGFSTEGVTAHWASGDEMWPGKTVFLIKFKKEVVDREEALKAGSG